MAAKKKSKKCTCKADHTEEDSVYRLYDVTGHLEQNGQFVEDSGLSGDSTVYCATCDKPI